MKLDVVNRCPDYNGYIAARVKSLFNVSDGSEFRLTADLPIEDDGWKVGLVVGPSGSGKSSIGRLIWGESSVYDPGGWPSDRPVVEALADCGASFDDATGALAAVGLGSVPAWLRPYQVLSNGEQFRANLARALVLRQPRIVIDEFTSVVDRQIARVGALAFQKSWRRTGGQCVLLSCHYDILDWVEPDWMFDTSTATFARGGLWRRPAIELEIWQTDWRHWPMFEPHHYLKMPRMVAATNYVGVIDGEPVAHVAVSTRPGMKAARACRLVVMPEWQGAGVGLRFLNAVCQLWRDGENRYGRRFGKVFFHTSHPGLIAALLRSPRWRKVSAVLYGVDKVKSARSIAASGSIAAGYGGHFRAVSGFVYR